MRLIDADALEQKMLEREEKLGDDKSMWESSAVSVALDMFAPTVIAYTKDEVISMLEELYEKMREKHEEYFAREEFDEAYGIDDAMDDVRAKIKELRNEV